MNTSPWNKDRIIGQKRPLQISHIWGIRIRVTNGAKVGLPQLGWKKINETF